MIGFYMGDEQQEVLIEPTLLTRIQAFQQRNVRDAESGGGLFAQTSKTHLTLAYATGPYPDDQRTRYSYTVDRNALNRDIDFYYSRHIYFIGLWHTHPEIKPIPSRQDMEAMVSLFTKNEHRLNAMLMLIIGTSKNPFDLWLSLHNATAFEQVTLTSF